MTGKAISNDWACFNESRVGVYQNGTFNLLDIPNGTSVPVGVSTVTRTPTPQSRYQLSLQTGGSSPNLLFGAGAPGMESAGISAGDGARCRMGTQVDSTLQNVDSTHF